MMLSKYTVAKAGWIMGTWYDEGTDLEMSAGDAKYLEMTGQVRKAVAKPARQEAVVKKEGNGRAKSDKRAKD